jgi:hypothetical protein
MAGTGWGHVDIFFDDLTLDLAKDVLQALAAANIPSDSSTMGHNYSQEIPVTVNRLQIRVHVEGFPWFVSTQVTQLLMWEMRGFTGGIYESTPSDGA